MIINLVDQFAKVANVIFRLATRFFFLLEISLALILTVIVYKLNTSIIEPSILKEIAQFIVTITANLWAILIAALVILFPQGGNIKVKSSTEIVARCFKALVALFVCTLVTSCIYFIATEKTSNSILTNIPVIAGIPILLFFYSLIIVLTITFKVIQEYGDKDLLPQWIFFFHW